MTADEHETQADLNADILEARLAQIERRLNRPNSAAESRAIHLELLAIAFGHFTLTPREVTQCHR